jgi:AcrR family transcriptional regulator
MPRPTRHDQVLDAASALFARQGFAGTSIREVAAGAKLTKAGLYYHIREKEDLLERICSFSIEAILAGARQALAEAASPRARLAALIRNHIDFFIAHPDNLVVLNNDRHALPSAKRRQVEALQRAYLDLIRGVLAEGRVSGDFRPVDASVAAFTLLGALNTLDRWYRPDGAVGPAALSTEIESIVCDGLSLPSRGHGRAA